MKTREDVNDKLAAVAAMAKSLSKGGWWAQDAIRDIQRMKGLLDDAERGVQQFIGADR